MTTLSFLVLGGGEGWHSDQLLRAANKANCDLQFAPYESLSSKISTDSNQSSVEYHCDAGSLASFDAILTRTMPPGSLERITFRLAILHACVASDQIVVNHPRALEIAIDKFATLEHVSRLRRLGSFDYQVPTTRVAQTRREAIDAFHELGGDCIVKPIFGGEGRGVMRIRDAELAWYSFATLDQLDAVFYVQQFVPPGGKDTRLLCIGDDVIAIRRENARDFRTNALSGAVPKRVEPSAEMVAMSREIISSIGLEFASVDFIDSADGPVFLEVNAVPGWKAAQSVAETNIAESIIQHLVRLSAGKQSLSRQKVGSEL